jgi:hypothetical protein
MPYFGASLTDDANSVSYDPNMFMIQATGVSDFASLTFIEILVYR